MTDNTRANIGHNNPPALDVVLKDRYEPLTKRVKAWEKKAKAADQDPKTLEDCLALDKLVADGATLAGEAKTAQEKEKEEPAKMVKIIDGFFLSKGIVGQITPLKDTLNTASAKRKVAIARAEQAKAEAKALADKKAADELEAKGRAAEDRGEYRLADQHFAKADDRAASAQSNTAVAQQDLASATRVETGGIRAAATAKMKCASVIKADLDLEALRPYLKPADLVDAVNAALKLDASFRVKGAVLEEDYSQRVSRK